VKLCNKDNIKKLKSITKRIKLITSEIDKEIDRQLALKIGDIIKNMSIDRLEDIKKSIAISKRK
jgi:hypothetical protein